MTPSSASSRAPLTAPAVVCRTRDGLEALAPIISAFLDPTPYWTIERATAHGDAQLLQRVIDNHRRSGSLRITDPHYIAHVVRKAFVLAVRHDNDVELLECLLQAAPALHTRVSASRGAEEAATLGKVHVLQWFKDHCRNVVWTNVPNCAAHIGHVHVLEWLKRNAPEYEEVLFERAIESALPAGQLAVLQWLYDEDKAQASSHMLPLTDLLFEIAISHGHLSIVQFLRQHGYESMQGPESTFAMQVPIDLPIVQWLAANGYKPFCKHALGLAAGAGDIDVVQWLLTNEPELQEHLVDDGIKLAAASGHLEIVQLLHDKCAAAHVYSDMATSAARNGHFALVQWIVENMRARAYPHDVPFLESDPVEAAAASGHLEIAAWIHAHRAYPEFAMYYLEPVAASGNLRSLEWIAALSTTRRTINAARAAVAAGHLHVVQWLYEHYGHEDNGVWWSAMDVAAEHGHLHIVQWLQDVGRDHCTTKAMDNAAQHGHLDVVQWLHEHRTEGCTTQAMDSAAANGDFETLLFLQTHRSEGCSTRAVFGALEQLQVDIVWWLCDHFPDSMPPTYNTIPFQLWDASFIAQLRSGEAIW